MLANLLGLILLAVPGPDSVAVVTNANEPRSLELAMKYQFARELPASHVCELDVSSADEISLEDFRRDIIEPLKNCLEEGGINDRIEAFVLTKGLPLRVTFSADGTSRTVSLAAALMIAESTMNNGEDLLGQSPGRVQMCGSGPCYAAKWMNPFTGTKFGPAWSKSSQGVNWNMRLVTMLNGRTYADAAKLIASATTAEAQGGARGDFVFMQGGDSARSFLDSQYPRIVSELMQRGFTQARIIPYEQDASGLQLASFVVGTLALGNTIESNEFAPGSLVDNLTSYGAVPNNFSEDGETQVSIARWVAQGVGGAHGTTAEPLANSFPDRDFLLDYVDGMTLAQAFYRRMPFVYWQNLVLGDPMLAPYAVRPIVTIEGVSSNEVVQGSGRIRVSASDPMFRGIASLKLYQNGQLLQESQGEAFDLCAVFTKPGSIQLLAVAQVFGISERYDQYLPKGWASIQFTAEDGPSDCPEALFDAGAAAMPDSGPRVINVMDAGQPVQASNEPSQACACGALGASRDDSIVFMLAFLVTVCGIRRRLR